MSGDSKLLQQSWEEKPEIKQTNFFTYINEIEIPIKLLFFLIT